MNNNLRKICLSFTSLSWILAAPALAAQEAKTLPKILVTASDEDAGVDGYKTEFSRSSTRTNTALIDTPQSISVVTQDQIQDQNVTNMSEALRYVPGVTVETGEGNRDQIVIRGNNSTADFYVDGARDDMQYFRDFYNVDRIEVLKGPNAMAFGRGGSGGVVNRITKKADGKRMRQLTLTGGSFNNRRFVTDLGDKVNDKLAVRLNAMYEKSGTFRKTGDLERFGINPTLTYKFSNKTDLKFGYEYVHDDRVNDRGIPSDGVYAYKTDPSTFFGNPNENEAETTTNSVFAEINHDFDDSTHLRNLTRYTNNSKYYQNVYVSGPVSSGSVDMKAYNNTQSRDSVTNQTDLTKKFKTGSLQHTALTGLELTRQDSDITKLNGSFGGLDKITVTTSDPYDYTPVSYNSVSYSRDSEAQIYAGYVQDQIEVNKYLQFIGGVRYDSVNMKVIDNTNGDVYENHDDFISPRLGVVVKPQESVSIYGNYNVSYLPATGDQFNSATLSSSGSLLKAEKLQNYEIGAKWDVTPRLNLSAALYQLDRDNTKATDPNDANAFVATGSSRTKGIELSVNGRITNKWQMIAGYAFQNAEITSKTDSAAKGAKVSLVPKNRFTLWNKYDLTEKFSAGLGVVSQSSQFAAADNTVRIKGFTRFDGALYYSINKSNRLQLNVENIFDRNYIQTAYNNNNIMPGSTRAYKLSLITNF